MVLVKKIKKIESMRMKCTERNIFQKMGYHDLSTPKKIEMCISGRSERFRDEFDLGNPPPSVRYAYTLN